MMTSESITSRRNPHIQHIKRLLSSHQIRKSEQEFVLEGVRLVEEAVRSDWQIAALYYSDRLNERGKKLIEHLSESRSDLYQVSDQVLGDITETETPQGILAVIKTRELPLPANPSLFIILDAIRDPGNVGTILRTAVAVGVDAVLFAPETVDPFSPKVLRAGMGAQLKIPAYPLAWSEIQAIIKEQSPMKVYLADTQGGHDFWNTDLRSPIAIIVSNEANGPSHSAREISDGILTIPMPGKSESLNAAIAASLLVYEVLRQRQEQVVD
jgi:TrmH family RNA methyltransferase